VFYPVDVQLQLGGHYFEVNAELIFRFYKKT